MLSKSFQVAEEEINAEKWLFDWPGEGWFAVLKANDSAAGAAGREVVVETVGAIGEGEKEQSTGSGVDVCVVADEGE